MCATSLAGRCCLQPGGAAKQGVIDPVGEIDQEFGTGDPAPAGCDEKLPPDQNAEFPLALVAIETHQRVLLADGDDARERISRENDSDSYAPVANALPNREYLASTRMPVFHKLIAVRPYIWFNDCFVSPDREFWPKLVYALSRYGRSTLTPALTP